MPAASAEPLRPPAAENGTAAAAGDGRAVVGAPLDEVPSPSDRPQPQLSAGETERLGPWEPIGVRAAAAPESASVAIIGAVRWRAAGGAIAGAPLAVEAQSAREERPLLLFAASWTRGWCCCVREGDGSGHNCGDCAPFEAVDGEAFCGVASPFASRAEGSGKCRVLVEGDGGALPFPATVFGPPTLLALYAPLRPRAAPVGPAIATRCNSPREKTPVLGALAATPVIGVPGGSDVEAEIVMVEGRCGR